jgi:hypothetical protein
MKPSFDPVELRPLSAFAQEKKLPMSLRHATYLAKLGTFPAFKINRVWHTSEGLIRSYLWQQANPEAKKLTA